LHRLEDGRLVLADDVASLAEESYIYRRDAAGDFVKFAWNPWPQEAVANSDGNFTFQDEDRFPLFRQERDSDGKVIYKDGYQVWTPVNLNLGNTTAFETVHAVREAHESWAGRKLPWGQNGLLKIEPHVFIDFNAFYSPSARMLFFGVIPYRLKGETSIKMMETATSFDLVAHESGHAMHHVVKPNIDQIDRGYNVWGESFGDQTAMWTSLRDRGRLLKLLADTNGNLDQSNNLTQLCEAYSVLVGTPGGIRDAYNDNKVSNTSDEIHDRSTVLTGAAYRIFLRVYSTLKSEEDEDGSDALAEAGRIMGVFLVRSTDYTPENQLTLEDIAKAYLKVDKEFFRGAYHDVLVNEFIRRELFDASSDSEWMAHEAAIPSLRLRGRSADDKLEQFIQANLDKLGIGADFGLKLQSAIQDDQGQTIVRVQLTMGRGDDATLVNNHGILVFRRNGTLADFHPPIPGQQGPQVPPVYQSFQAAKLHPMITRAKQLGLDQHDAPLSIVRRANGELTVEAHVIKGEGLNAHMEVFTLDNPFGERRELMISPLPPDKRISIPNDLIK
jgi:hypothetical protein